MGGGGWKRVALDGNKERFVQKKGFWYVKKAVFEDSKKLIEQAMFWLRKREAFEGKASSFLQMENFCFAEKGCFFQLMQS